MVVVDYAYQCSRPASGDRKGVSYFFHSKNGTEVVKIPGEH